MEDAPSHRYYRSLEGRWSGTLALAVTDWRAFRAAPMTWLDRVRIAWMATVGRLIGPPTMSTTLDCGALPGEALHTTRVAKWGATVFSSREVIALAADGRAFTMTSDQRFWPRMGVVVTIVGPGSVEETATGATYRIPWAGTEMVQRTRIVPGGLAVTQETPWSHAEVLLVRTSPSP